ncbi:MAG: ABC transporter ATP-binding protein [Pseudomonadota bacterium]|nr:ABC transporter ATP-binding protein [Pseudomonadota bacterium]
MKNILSLSNISKYYPNVTANDAVSLELESGKIHALLGENGAGKSTLVKIIYGLVKPDLGEMVFDHKVYKPENPKFARKMGIGMVFQHFSLFDALTVFENIAIGMDKRFDRSQLQNQIDTVAKQYGLSVSLNKIVGNLSAGERQRIEIVRCLLQDPKVMIMDEPTSVLTPGEVSDLFIVLRKLAAQGVSILYISHKLEEIRTLCSKATIMRNGKVVNTCDPRKLSAGKIAESMVGASFSNPKKNKVKAGQVLLELKSISFSAKRTFGIPIKNINLKLYEGQIVGIGGVAGNGQDELLGLISGELLPTNGSIILEGKEITSLGPVLRRQKGLLSAPEERLGHSAAPEMTLTENCLITAEKRMSLSRRGVLNYTKSRKLSESIIKELDVRANGPDSLAKSLSGGNLQKFVIGRELIQNPKIFVVNQPTWGVDAAAASSIRQKILDLAQGGASIVVISQDLDELLQISDVFCALVGGHLSKPVKTNSLNPSSLGLLLTNA